jgi:hypothetical protein
MVYRMDDYNDTYPFSLSETYSVSGSNHSGDSIQSIPGGQAQRAGRRHQHVWPAIHLTADQYLQSWNLTVEREIAKSTSTIYTGPPFTPRLGTFDYTAGARTDRIASAKTRSRIPQ